MAREYSHGSFGLTCRPRTHTQIIGYLKVQSRLSHLAEEEVTEAQRATDEEWRHWEEVER